MANFLNFTPDMWLTRLGVRNFLQYYHLIAELTVIWQLMVDTYEPVPYIEYLGAREAMLSMYYEP